ncbi:hypothetical protein B0T17DRAFT_511798 [Bombardia bombarda]|uniref:SnoaL-like domain-containing protein n=1 Tax=Bombardia bombarda TaxID=252184 RepID=A0AA39TZG6_9PEZI|nr:hypothetical protein B0T17DRAFT_511798 [Bombardia bombarda]
MSARRQLTLAAIDAYNEWDIAKIMAFRAPECTHVMLPKSAGLPTKNNAEYEAGFQPNLFRNFNITVNDIIEDDKANKVVLLAQSSADTDAGPYENEYVLILEFNEAGDKVTRFIEFFDSAGARDLAAKLTAPPKDGGEGLKKNG